MINRYVCLFSKISQGIYWATGRIADWPELLLQLCEAAR